MLIGSIEPTARGSSRTPPGLLELHHQAVERKIIGTSESDRLKFLTLAEHARSVGKSNPPGLLAALLRRGAWSFITPAEEEDFFEKTDSGEKPVKDPIGECWGRTESEARSKVRKAAEAYIKQREAEDARPPSA